MLGITRVVSPLNDDDGDVEAVAPNATPCDVKWDGVDVGAVVVAVAADDDDDLRTTSNFKMVHLSVCWYWCCCCGLCDCSTKLGTLRTRVVVFVPAEDVIKARGGEVALFAVEIVRTVVVDGKGKMEMDGTLVATRPPLEIAVARTSPFAGVVMVVVTLASSPPPLGLVLADAVAFSGPIGCCIRTKFGLSVVSPIVGLTPGICNSFSGMRPVCLGLGPWFSADSARTLERAAVGEVGDGDDDVDADGEYSLSVFDSTALFLLLLCLKS